MRAVLDHIGIAVEDLPKAMAFYRDALGLEVEPPEEVEAQKVRAHFIPVGRSALELLEPTSPESTIARFIERHGPGVHHVTLRVENIQAALDLLKARGIRLIDEVPRLGAEGAMVAFVHPVAAHGVLVELKQQPNRTALATVRTTLGSLQLTSVNDGTLKLDGGAMFGTVPRVLWERRIPADDRHRIGLSSRPLVVEGEWGRMLIDCGCGDKMDTKQADIFGVEGSGRLDRSLESVGLGMDDFDVVLASHLHFDHFGGATTRNASGAVVPRFPKAEYVIRGAEWEDATHPHERNRASYIQGDFLPLKAGGVAAFYEGDQAIRPGVRVQRTGGHTGQHQIVYVESSGRTAVFTADLIPTTAHIDDAWIMGYDLFPMETLAFKRRFIREAIDSEYLIFFEHDPQVPAGYIREKDGRRFVEPLRS